MQVRRLSGLRCALAALSLLGAAACNPLGAELRLLALSQGAHPAMQRYRAAERERGGPSGEALASLAMGLLERAAAAEDSRERSAGFAALRSLGVRARESLRALSVRPGVVGDRAAAMLWEVNQGELGPERRLAEASRSEDPERRVAGLVWFEANNDLAGLVAALDALRPEVRAAAAARLRRRGASSALDALAARALHDPEELVRLAAIQSLAGAGEGAVSPLREALRDAEHVVRMAAMGALARVSRDAAREPLLAILDGPDLSESLEAARLLAPGEPRAVSRLLRGLEAPNPQERAQAAVGVSSLGDSFAEALSPHIEDADVEVRLRVGALLLRRSPALRERVLRALRPATRHADPLVAVRALSVLSEVQEESAAEGLRGALRAPNANIRRIAAVAWGNLAAGTGEVEPLLPLLEDEDRSTRLVAAAEIVRSAAR